MPLTAQLVSVSPAGNGPVIEHAYGGVPPLAVIDALYATPTVPFGRVFVRTSAEGAMTMVSFALAV